jgi:hypothetical protein
MKPEYGNDEITIGSHAHRRRSAAFPGPWWLSSSGCGRQVQARQNVTPPGPSRSVRFTQRARTHMLRPRAMAGTGGALVLVTAGGEDPVRVRGRGRSLG